MGGENSVVRTRRMRPPASEIRPDTPIWCPACESEHPASAFNRESRRYSGLHGVCREAQRRKRQTPEGRAATAARNKRRWEDSEYRGKSREWSRARRERLGSTHDLKRARARLSAVVAEWKSTGCVDCGYSDVRAIDPDHRELGTKAVTVSRMIQMCASVARIKAELALCEPRCARCHRARTKEQLPASNRSRGRLPRSWARRIEFQDRNDAMKLETGCADCSWAEHARGLDWDHVRGEKIRHVADLVAFASRWESVAAEVAKCECVCANCHRIRTAERRTASGREA